MSDEPRPRRALPPVEDDAYDDTPVTPARSARLVDSVPVPPKPALPGGGSTTSRPSAARRAAGYAPETDEQPVARRSALTPLSPESPTGKPRWRLRPEPASQPSAPRRAAAPLPSRGAHRIPRGWLITTLALLLILAVLLTALGLLSRRPPAPAPTTPAPLLLTPDDARPLLGSWEPTTTRGEVLGDPISCGPRGLSLPEPTSEQAGDLTNDNRRVRHVYTAYRDIADARSVYGTRLSEFGTCDVERGWLLTEAGRIGSLGDEAFYVVATTQDTLPVEHMLIATRAGTDVNVFDISGPAGSTRAQQVAVATSVVARQCEARHAHCATGATLTPAPLPSGSTPGFLAPADVPLVTPGVGHWIASAIASSVRTRGTLCETSLGSAPGAATQSQRSLILAADPQAPASFGIDNAVWTFQDAASAQRYADQLTQQIRSCPERVNTARVEPGQRLDTRFEDVTVTGTALTVTQSVNGQVLPYRVAVATAGRAVIYTVLTPTPTYTLSGDAWAKVATRAAARAAELA